MLRSHCERENWIVRFGKILPDPSTLKDWLRESDVITSWRPTFLSDITVFPMEDHPGKDVALHERVLNEYKEGKAYRLYESGWLKKKFTGTPYQLHRSFVSLKPTILIP